MAVLLKWKGEYHSLELLKQLESVENVIEKELQWTVTASMRELNMSP